MFNWHKKQKEAVQEAITRIDSPKVVREVKSRDEINPLTPRSARKGNDKNMQKLIHDLNNCCWTLKYDVDNGEYARGSYGKIMLASDKVTKEKVVIKQIPTTTPIRMINNEIRAGKVIGHHENVAALLSYNEKPDFHYLVFQYIQGSDLFTYLEQLNFEPRSEKDARKIITQILAALNFLHNKNVAHRDIKLENILIEPKTQKVTVIDFGLCAILDTKATLCKEWCGSDNYIAPEVCRKIPYDGFKADVFSTGVVLFCLLFGVFPFENLRVSGSSRLAKPLKLRFPADVKVSDEAKDLVIRMVEDTPEERFTIKDVLQHEWITEIESPKALKKQSLDSGVDN